MVVLLVVALLALPIAGAPAAKRKRTLPRELASPPGQVNVLTLNARQKRAVDLVAFGRIFDLVKQIRSRPTSFEGGNARATGMPDVIILQEMRFSNLEIMHRLLNQRSKFRYEIAAVEGAMAKFLYNTNTVSLVGVPETWVDPCRSGVAGGETKTYQFARFAENATNEAFLVAGVHFKARYEETGQPDCRERNVQVTRGILNVQAVPLILGGDFNYRAMAVERECDPDERSDPRIWHQMFTDPQDGGRPYVDAVRDYHRQRGASMEDEWTFERSRQSTLCSGDTGYRRSRLDYLFAADMAVAEAHADHPGWAGAPGQVPLKRARYSDHRWVFGRFVLAGVERPKRPEVSLDDRAVVELSWPAIDGVTQWIVYRAQGNKPYSELARITADLTTYQDTSPQHGETYRYAVAAVGADGQGRESAGIVATPDGRGPRVRAVSPSVGKRNVSPFTSVKVWLDERADPDGLGPKSITMYRKGRQIGGRLRQVSGRRLVFNPNRKLRRNSSYRIVVRGLEDRLGNDGPRFAWTIHTR